jgi:DnaJ-class molecular chaperone
MRLYYSYNRQSGATGVNPYEVLGLTKSATEKEIKLAYFKQAKKYHPDMNPGDKNANANFQKVTQVAHLI